MLYNTPKFTQQVLTDVAEVSADTVKNCAKRGYVEIPDLNPGRGRPRLYTRRNVQMFSIIGRLGQFGIQVSISAEFAKDICDLIEERNVNGAEFAWSELFAIDPDSFKDPAPRRDCLWWERWGDLYSSYAEIDQVWQDEIKLYARSRLAEVTDDGDMRFEPISRAALKEPLTRSDFEAHADRTFEPPTYIVLPIGFMVNSVNRELNKVEFGPQ